ncbi:MAG: protein kinase, partial [Verrucomicrobiota bacterium]
MSQDPQQRLSALLFSDIAGSVDLQKRLGTKAYTDLITIHDGLFQRGLTGTGQHEILNETGDGVLVNFSRASDAVNAALRLQYLFHEQDWGTEPLHLRIGLHLGEVTAMKESLRGDSRAVGMAINLAARVMDLAHPGQILMLRSIFDDARQFVRQHPCGNETIDLPPLAWPAHGRYLFKGHDEPMEVFEVGIKGMAPLKPPADSEKAKRAVSADEEATLGWRPGIGIPIPRRSEWVLEKKLGQGGFGEVWLATQKNTKESRVFKFCFDPERLRSFKRELTLFRLLRDTLGKREDIASLYDVSVESPPFYLESEFVAAGNLGQWVSHQGGLASVPFDLRIRLMAQIAKAVGAAHSAGVVHKDIKPSNILIATENGQPKPRLADFGIGMLSDRQSLDNLGITELGFTETIDLESESTAAGTRLYTAPEYLVGQNSSPQGDLYSLGVMLYQMAVGDLNRPLGSGWERDVEDPVLREDITRCVDVEPSRRLESVEELADRLETLKDRQEALRQSKVESKRILELQAQARRRKRIALLTTLTTVILGMLVAALGYAFWQQKEQRETAENARIEQDKLRRKAEAASRKAQTVSSQSDFLLAAQLLERGKSSEAIAYLSRAVRNDPDNTSAAASLMGNLTLRHFLAADHPGIDLEPGRSLQSRLAVNSDGSRLAGQSKEAGFRVYDLQSGEALTGHLDHEGEMIR